MKARGPMARDEAEMLAIQALNFIAADSQRLGQFLAVTGIEPSQIRTAVRESEFLAGVLEYLIAEEQLVKEFTAELADPADITRSLIALRGTPWEREMP